MLSQFTPKDIERFWSKVDRSGGPDSCWMWAGRCHPYGSFQWGGRRGTFQRAHRVAFFLTYEVWPVHTHHRCQNKWCANPTHLESVSPFEHGDRHRWATCAHGHELCPENTYIIHERQKGYPVVRCRICRLSSNTKYRERHPRPLAIDPKNRGVTHHSAKLTAEKVRVIRARYVEGGLTLQQLADEYSVAIGSISAVVNRKTWRQVE
jgi:hypothetical protein